MNWHNVLTVQHLFAINVEKFTHQSFYFYFQSFSKSPKSKARYHNDTSANIPCFWPDVGVYFTYVWPDTGNDTRFQARTFPGDHPNIQGIFLYNR